MGLDPVAGAGKVSLRRWLRRQLRQRDPLREHLEASIENDDPAEARRIVAHFDFTDDQRHHVERLLEEWESQLRAPADDLKPPGTP